MSKNLIERLAKIQKNLVAPKNQRNNFGKYNYRSCEDILEGLKLVLDGLVVTISDDITVIADRVYVKATVTLTDGENSITNTALAREALTKKGMDESQITGACSSYARKYALNGMFLIDDNKDADSMDNKKPEVFTKLAKPELISKANLNELRKMFNTPESEGKFCNDWNINSLEGLHAASFKNAVEYIRING